MQLRSERRAQFEAAAVCLPRPPTPRYCPLTDFVLMCYVSLVCDCLSYIFSLDYNNVTFLIYCLHRVFPFYGSELYLFFEIVMSLIVFL